MNIILPLLGAVLVVLKLLGEITLPWVWVLAPFWIGLAIFAVLFLFFGVVALLSVGTRFK